MKLELKHLSPYLPYKLKGNYEVSEVVPSAKFELRNKELRTDNIDFFLNYAKPILRPLSDLTKEIEHNGEKFVPFKKLNWEWMYGEMGFRIYCEYGESPKAVVNVIDYLDDLSLLLSWHFDVFGLIEKGLAIDINTLPQSSE